MWARIFMAHISTFFGIMFGACTILHIWIDFMHWKKSRVVNYIHLWIVKLFKMRFWCTWNMMKRLRATPEKKKEKKHTHKHVGLMRWWHYGNDVKFLCFGCAFGRFFRHWFLRAQLMHTYFNWKFSISFDSHELVTKGYQYHISFL